jgi:hypothetical protein
VSDKSSELLLSLQKAWEEGQHRLAELRKQVEERAVVEKLWSEKEQADQKRQQALSDLGMALYEGIQRGEIVPQQHWEGLLQRVSDALQKAQERHQKLSELLEEGQALVSQTRESKK